MKHLLLIILLTSSLLVKSQPLQITSSTLVGTKNKLPFWLWANELGRYNPNSNFTQNFEFNGSYETDRETNKLNFHTGARINALLGEESSFRFTELYGGISWHFLQLNVGAFAEKEQYGGLSASNGNMAIGRNARPHPRIQVGFNRFVPIVKNVFSVQGLFEEGFLNDERWVDNTHLHRKTLYLRFGHTGFVELTGGMEHFVMWGGTHPQYGELNGWSHYYKYIAGEGGDDEALLTDQQNVMGNSYGIYNAKLRKHWKKVNVELYWNHPVDDFSGMQFDNLPDELYGLYLEMNSPTPFIKGINVEYIHTKHQSGSYHHKLMPDGTKRGSGRDDYFNHGIYRSGATYHQMAIVHPFFAPVNMEDGISIGFDNTRFSGIHLGANGYFLENLIWKGLLTHTDNFGKYRGDEGDTYDPARSQWSALGELSWQPKRLPLTVKGALAADRGSLFDYGEQVTRIGGQVSVIYLIAKN